MTCVAEPSFVIETARLRLREHDPADAPVMASLFNDIEVVRGTLSVPFPYTEANAREWIAGLKPARVHEGKPTSFAVTLRDGGVFVGSAGLNVDAAHRRAELGYMYGRAFWGRGYATEACRALLAYAFETLGLHIVYASHWGWNAASARVLEKSGMRFEGVLREHGVRLGEVQDSVVYGMVRGEYEAMRTGGVDG